MLRDYVITLFAVELAAPSRTSELPDGGVAAGKNSMKNWWNGLVAAGFGIAGSVDEVPDADEWASLQLTSPCVAQIGLWFPKQSFFHANPEKIRPMADRMTKNNGFDVTCILPLIDVTDPKSVGALAKCWVEMSLSPSRTLLLFEPELVAALKNPLSRHLVYYDQRQADSGPARTRATLARVKKERGKRLDLSRCGLSVIPPEVFQLPWIEELNLNGNELSSLPPEISRLSVLRNLDVSRNLLEELPPEIATLGALRQVDLTLNSFREFPSVLLTLSSLEQLTISNNQIRRLPLDMDRMAALTALHVAACGIDIIPDAIGSLALLTDLDLARNQIADLPTSMSRLGLLRKLNLYSNHLTEIPAWWHSFDSIVHLNIASNRISEVSDAFAPIPRLEVLICDDNNLPEQDLREDLMTVPPARIGEGEHIGEGGFSVVERLYTDGGVVARKIFRYGGRFGDQFENEARRQFLSGASLMQTTLAHKNIAPVYEIFDVYPHPYFHMEYFPHGDLSYLIHAPRESSHHLGVALENDRVPVGVSMGILADLCSALDFAHGRGASTGTSNPKT